MQGNSQFESQKKDNEIISSNKARESGQGTGTC